MRPPDRLCDGRDLPLCASCWRNAENHPEAERAQSTRWLSLPAVDGSRCRDWLPIPRRGDVRQERP